MSFAALLPLPRSELIAALPDQRLANDQPKDRAAMIALPLVSRPDAAKPRPE
jgi:hypothetical protein